MENRLNDLNIGSFFMTAELNESVGEGAMKSWRGVICNERRLFSDLFVIDSNVSMFCPIFFSTLLILNLIYCFSLLALMLLSQ